MPSAWAILLAAGESRRMGELKALLPWRGVPLLAYQVDALLAGGADGVVVVLGHQAERLQPLLESRPQVEYTLNPHYLEGKTTSLKAGLAAIAEKGCADLLLLNVDQPRTPGLVRRVLEEHRAAGQAITVPEFGGKGGHPIALSAGLLPELRNISEETQGLKAVVRAPGRPVHRPDLGAAETLLDLNTPEQYRAARGVSEPA